MSTPWGGPSDGSGSPYGGPPEPGPYGGPPFDGGPVDPHGGRAAAPVPTYNPYVNPGSWEPARYLPRARVPGTIVAGSIVGYVFALLLFVSGLFLLFFGSLVPDSFHEVDSTLGDGGAGLVVAGLGNWVAMGLLVTAGVTATVRRRAALPITVAATGLVVLLAVYWVVLYPYGLIVFWALVHTAFALVVAGLLAVPPANRAWLAGVPGSGPPPGPAGPPPFQVDRYGRPFGS